MNCIISNFWSIRQKSHRPFYTGPAYQRKDNRAVWHCGQPPPGAAHQCTDGERPVCPPSLPLYCPGAGPTVSVPPWSWSVTHLSHLGLSLYGCTSHTQLWLIYLDVFNDQLLVERLMDQISQWPTYKLWCQFQRTVTDIAWCVQWSVIG